MILEEIAARTRERVEEAKRRHPLTELRAQAREQAIACAMDFPFERALAKKDMSFICEVKKASPSKGVIAADFPYVEIAKEYERAGADAISILTEPYYFQGADAYLTAIRKEVSIPLLRKDFTVDAYMLYEAKVIGADAVLLICSILSPTQLAEYVGIAKELGLSALVEAHDEAEIEMALQAGAGIIGVNNRNLKDFTVDIGNSLRLRKRVPQDILFVSESGMKTREDIARLEENGTDAVLIGETFMRSEDKAAMLWQLRGSGNQSDMNRTKIKICGLFRLQDIDSVNQVRPDFAGFILTPGFRRSIDRAQAMEFRRALDADIPAVGVFVNAAREEVLSYLNEGIIQMVQLHGAETESDIRFLKEASGKPVMKAIKVSGREDIEAWLDSAADYLVLDGGTGAGVAFDWSLLEGIARKYFLAGGLHAGNLREALALSPFAVDMSSGVETDGVKDLEKMQKVVNLVRGNTGNPGRPFAERQEDS